MKITINEIAQATGGKILQVRQDSFDSFGIDSRKIPSNGLFFAIKGESTDGHLFLENAFQNGAAGAVIDQADAVHRVPPGATVVLVPDSMRALQDLASFARDRSPSKYVGITGSSGKTSTKEFTAELLSARYSTYKNEGNLNSLTGLPLSLLSMEPKECAVLEVAMNRPGEIGRLSEVLRPHVGVVMNVNPVHALNFRSIEEIADEKCSLVRGMSEESTVIYNADDPLIQKRLKSRPKKFTYGFSPKVDLKITDVRMRGVKGSSAVLSLHGQQIRVETNLCGFGNLYNIAAAASVALTLNVPALDIALGITKLQPFQQRGILIHSKGVDIYDDTYNSNPKALEMILRMAGESRGYKRKIAVLGDMLELGTEEIEYHRKAGDQVGENRFDILITAGSLSKFMEEGARKAKTKVILTENSEEAAAKAVELVTNGDLVIVKGSRGMKMENVVRGLQERE